MKRAWIAVLLAVACAAPARQQRAEVEEDDVGTSPRRRPKPRLNWEDRRDFARRGTMASIRIGWQLRLSTAGEDDTTLILVDPTCGDPRRPVLGMYNNPDMQRDLRDMGFTLVECRGLDGISREQITPR